MKYLCLVYLDERRLEEVADADCMACGDALRASGHMVAGEALESVHTATTVRMRNGRMTVTDGPFAETKEQLAGFYMIEARDLNEAIQIAGADPAGARRQHRGAARAAARRHARRGRRPHAARRRVVRRRPDAAPAYRSDSTPRRTLRLTRRFAAPPAAVFAAWLDADRAGRWLFATASRPMADVRMEPRVGGTFHLAESRAATPHQGRYLEIVPERRLVFTLAGPMHARATARVRVELAPRGRGCALTLTHEDVPSADAPHARNRWSGILYGLDVALRN